MNRDQKTAVDKLMVKIEEGGAYNPDRYRINRGEPGGSIVTEFRDGRPILNSTFVDLTECHFAPGPKAPERGDRS